MNDQSLLEDVAVEFSNPQERNILCCMRAGAMATTLCSHIP